MNESTDSESHTIRLNTTEVEIEKTDVEICNVQDPENLELLITYSVKENTSLHGCDSDRNDRKDHRRIINEDKVIQAKDKRDLYPSVRTHCNENHHKVVSTWKDNTFIADTHLIDLLNAQIPASIGMREHLKSESNCTDPKLKTDIVVGSPNITKAHHANRNRDALDAVGILSHKLDISCSQTLSQDGSNQGLTETLPQVSTIDRKPEGEERVSGVFFQEEQFGRVCTSSITFSTKTTDSFPLGPCCTGLTVSPKGSTLSSPVRLSDSDREELTDGQPDQKRPQVARSQSWQVAALTHDITPTHLDQGGAVIRTPLNSMDMLLEGAQSGSVERGTDSTQIQSDSGDDSEERLLHHLKCSNNLLVFSGKQKAEDTSTLLSESCIEERRREGSPCCSLFWQNKQQGVESSRVHHDQKSIQDSSRENPDIAQKAISQKNKKTDVSKISSHCKQVQLVLKIPELPCGLNASLSNGTSDPSEDIDKSQENSEGIPSTLNQQPNWISEDAESVPGKNLDSYSHLSLAHSHELEKLQRKNNNEDNNVVILKFKCSNSERNEGLQPFVLCSESRGLLMNSTFRKGLYCSQLGAHSLLNRRRRSLYKSLEEYMAEECRVHTQVRLPAPQHEVRVVRYSDPDVSLNLLAVSSLEPILEAERSPEKHGTTEDVFKIEKQKEYDVIRPPERVVDLAFLSGDTSSPKRPHHLPEQEEASFELEPEANPSTPVLCGSGKEYCSPMSVTYGAVPHTSAISNCNELQNPHFAIPARNADLENMTKRCKTKSNQTGIKDSKMSVFAKMPYFRKAKSSKDSKGEEVPQESSDGGGEGLLSEQVAKKDNSDVESFLKKDILNQTVHQTFSSLDYKIEEEDYDLSSSTHVRQLVGQRSSGEDNEGQCPGNPFLKEVKSPDEQTDKRSKSIDSLNICMRFAQAHKSLSSLFESRFMYKDNEERATKQSWRKTKKAPEAEPLKRTLSAGEYTNSASGRGCREIPSSPRLGSSGLPSSLRALPHTDPIAKRGVPQGSSKENPHGCKSEGQRRKCSPSQSTPLCASGLPPFLDDTAVPQPNHTSPVSPLRCHSLSTLSYPFSPTWVKAHPAAREGLTKSPLRPMSPKPNSPMPAGQRTHFYYPLSPKACSVCPIVLGQSISMEGLTEPPERPRTLKPSTSPLGLSPLEATEGSISYSHISLYAIGSINTLEVRRKTQSICFCNI